MLDHALKYVEAFKLLEEEDEFYTKCFMEEDRYGKKKYLGHQCLEIGKIAPNFVVF